MVKVKNFKLTSISRGETKKKETLTNIREAIEGYLEAFPEDLDNQTEQHERRRYKGLSVFFFRNFSSRSAFNMPDAHACQHETSR